MPPGRQRPHGQLAHLHRVPGCGEATLGLVRAQACASGASSMMQQGACTRRSSCVVGTAHILRCRCALPSSPLHACGSLAQHGLKQPSSCSTLNVWAPTDTALCMLVVQPASSAIAKALAADPGRTLCSLAGCRHASCAPEERPQVCRVQSGGLKLTHFSSPGTG